LLCLFKKKKKSSKESGFAMGKVHKTPRAVPFHQSKNLLAISRTISP
jgi:hypothetical protein